jgi:peptidoglycan/LPS O-acetylase OafA/YrhL
VTPQAPTSQPEKFRPPVLPRLTSTRAIAALLVFFAHIDKYDVLTGVPVGVAYSVLAYFFVLSGFVLTWSTDPRTPKRTYYRRRIARIWPNHLTMLFIALIVPVTVHPPTVKAFIAHLFLVQAWIPDGDVLFGMNGLSWSLSVEVAFYAVLPLLVPVLRRLSPRRRWLVAGGVFAADSVVVLVAAHLGGNIATGGYALPPLRAGEFMLGCVAALEVARGWRLARRRAVIIVGTCVAIAVLLPHPIPTLNVVLTPMWLALILGWVQADLAGRKSPLTWRWMVYGGDLAFAFYLVHELTILNLQHWLDLSGVGLTAIAFAVSLAGAMALHHGVERPAQRRLSHPGRRGASDGPPP